MSAESASASRVALERADRILVTDVGSTTTKAILFARKGGRWSFFREEATTTVERPHEDVTVGVLAAIRALERTTGETLLDRGEREGGAPAVPLLSTSSAGGGLAMVVTGLVSQFTAETADRVALGAGAIVLDVVCVNDRRSPYRQIEDLTRLRPDMVLLAGGFDGEAMSGPVFLAELIVESDLHPKLNPEQKLPVVYGGNVNARDYVQRALGDRFLFHPVENVRPTEQEENPGPAREAIHRLFMDHVMSQAPGYERLKPWVSLPIRPTPAAFANVLKLVSEELGGSVLAIDIGGATTDVFTAGRGKVMRTVSANLGMSYSVLNVLEQAGPRAVASLLDFEIEDRDIWNRVGDKHVNPTALPETPEEVALERALASVAIRAAVREHLRVMRGTPDGDRPAALDIETMLGPGTAGAVGLRDYDIVVGSGGILSHSPRDAAAKMLVDALAPTRAVELAVDSAFMFPHLGVLGEADASLATELFFELGLVRLGTYEPGEEARALAVRTSHRNTAGPPADRDPARAHRVALDDAPRLRRGRVLERRELAIEGEVFVRKGDALDTDTVVARSVRQFLRPFFLHVARDLDIDPEQIGDVLLKGVGDVVAVGEMIARVPRRVLGPKQFRAPVEGTIEKILPDGTLVVRESPERAQVLTSVQVARELGVHPSRLKPYLRVDAGEELERGQWLAAVTGTAPLVVSKSPVRGRVNRIDRQFGIVMIEPVLEEEEVLAWLPGKVEDVTERGCVVAAEVTEIDGVWGWGGEASGFLSVGALAAGGVVVCGTVDRALIEEASRAGVAGLIGAGAHLRDVLDGEPAFSVVVTEGFGERVMPAELADLLAARAGALVLIDGTTQLRVGVRRPRIVMPARE
jgi:uncharacterized protein (TIGR01319 family)